MLHYTNFEGAFFRDCTIVGVKAVVLNADFEKLGTIKVSDRLEKGSGCWACKGRFTRKLIMKDVKVSDLTVSQLQELIRETVQEAVAEVLIEFNAIAEAEEQLRVEAELAEYLRTNMQGNAHNALYNNSQVDD